MKGSMKIQDKTPSLSYQQYIWAAPVSFLLYLTSFIYLFKIFGHASIVLLLIVHLLLGYRELRHLRQLA